MIREWSVVQTDAQVPAALRGAEVQMSVPDRFCWTRFGPEAGQTVQQTLARKEHERSANDGVFLWGIGNALGPSIQRLLTDDLEPTVLFSPIRSKARAQDQVPDVVLVWTEASTMDGGPMALPPRFLVTSRGSTSGRKHVHYALVCYSESPLVTAELDSLPLGALKNLLTGRPVGASQVTAVVRFDPASTSGASYTVSLRARLVPPYLLRLHRPIAVERSDDCPSWTEAVTRLHPPWSTPDETRKDLRGSGCEVRQLVLPVG